MNELDILKLFYEEMIEKGITRNEVFLTLEEEAAAKLSQKYKKDIPVEMMQKYVDKCIANEWLERTTADVHYKFLSLTEAGLQMVIANQYS